MEKKYSYKRIRQAPGPLHSDIKARVSAIEDILQQQEDTRLAREIYNDGINDTEKGSALSGALMLILWVTLGVLLGKVLFSKDQSVARPASRFS